MNYDELKKRFDRLNERYNSNFYATRYPTSIAWNTLTDELDQLAIDALSAAMNVNGQPHLFVDSERTRYSDLSVRVNMLFSDARLIRDYTNNKRDQGCI